MAEKNAKKISEGIPEEITKRMELFIGRPLKNGEIKRVGSADESEYCVYGITQKIRDNSVNFIFCMAKKGEKCRVMMRNVRRGIASSIDEAYQEGSVTYIANAIKIEW